MGKEKQCDYWDSEAGTCRKSEIAGKTGRWKRISPAGIYECSECGQNVMTGDIECYQFCHGCGAKMEGVK